MSEEGIVINILMHWMIYYILKVKCITLNEVFEYPIYFLTDPFYGKLFFIISKDVQFGRLTQYRGNNMGVYTGDIYSDQKWIIEPNLETPGFYYIKNLHRGNRLTQWGTDTTEVGAPSDAKTDEALWKFVKVDTGEYRIYNYVHQGYRLTYWSGSGTFGIYAGALHHDQVWILKETSQ